VPALYAALTLLRHGLVPKARRDPLKTKTSPRIGSWDRCGRRARCWATAVAERHGVRR